MIVALCRLLVPLPAAALAFAALIVPACERARPPVAAPHEVPSGTALVTPSTAIAFSWERLLLVGDATLAGPALASVAEVGRRVSVRAGDGEPWTAEVDWVDDERCEAAPNDACLDVSVEYDSDESELPPVPWQRVSMAGKDLPDDIALLDVHLAVDIDTALPRLVPHTIEVRYANALCEEADADADDYALVGAYTSAGPDPVEGVSALEGKRQYPRRVVTLRTLDRTLHFVTVAQVDRPPSGRMSDIPKDREVALWILEGEGKAAKVLHHASHTSSRTINTDSSCQLPLRYPTPWSVVEVEGSVYVLTRSGVSDFERWLLKADAITREGGWTAEINPLG
jgi:hypothetical protein